ncbi:MAG: PadR family transcriptional regulator [Spirochaetia bacterium]|nr:PadR family transcriptional regulator [Spirochaetia bacterium]
MPESDMFSDDLGKALEKWRSQSRKGFLELCLLACVKGAGRSYGFAMLDSMAGAGLDVGEGSLYPLLARLVREGVLDAAWDTPPEGHPRKYYKLSSFGERYLERLGQERDKDQKAYKAILSGACASSERPRGGGGGAGSAGGPGARLIVNYKIGGLE